MAQRNLLNGNSAIFAYIPPGHMRVVYLNFRYITVEKNHLLWFSIQLLFSLHWWVCTVEQQPGVTAFFHWKYTIESAHNWTSKKCKSIHQTSGAGWGKSSQVETQVLHWVRGGLLTTCRKEVKSTPELETKGKHVKEGVMLHRQSVVSSQRQITRKTMSIWGTLVYMSFLVSMITV